MLLVCCGVGCEWSVLRADCPSRPPVGPNIITMMRAWIIDWSPSSPRGYTSHHTYHGVTKTNTSALSTVYTELTENSITFQLNMSAVAMRDLRGGKMIWGEGGGSPDHLVDPCLVGHSTLLLLLHPSYPFPRHSQVMASVQASHSRTILFHFILQQKIISTSVNIS